MKSFKEMQVEVTKVNRDNGWFDDTRTFGDGIALLHSEVSEALEEYRDHGLNDMTLPKRCPDCGQSACPDAPLSKPLGVGSEYADILIRLLDSCERDGFDLEAEYERKLAYNRTRGYKHGGKLI